MNFIVAGDRMHLYGSEAEVLNLQQTEILETDQAPLFGCLINAYTRPVGLTSANAALSQCGVMAGSLLYSKRN